MVTKSASCGAAVVAIFTRRIAEIFPRIACSILEKTWHRFHTVLWIRIRSGSVFGSLWILFRTESVPFLPSSAILWVNLPRNLCVHIPSSSLFSYLNVKGTRQRMICSTYWTFFYRLLITDEYFLLFTVRTGPDSNCPRQEGRVLKLLFIFKLTITGIL